uniref:Uncharacterized protein n=1 Tax=Acrobeloides nanus TaxID=290746 RepID=A0A914E877_9BILA
MGLLVILLLSLVDYYVGTFITPTNQEQLKRGLTGYSVATLKENLLPAFRDGYNFFAVFSIYFPATTGIMAGANISGDLKDPQRAIPLGTLLAIFVTTLIYLGTVWTTGFTCLRDADGDNIPQLLNDTLTYSGISEIVTEHYTPNPIQEYVVPDCAFNGTCPYGLMNFFQVMELSSLWGPLITAGIFAATLSSALASLVSAPKIFQAVCKDRLFPYIGYFEKGYGRNDEPRRAYALTFVISMLMCLIGDLNLIAPIISNFYLCAYALINYACFDNSFVHSPGFRPGFRFYNMWVSLFGALLCVNVMFIISWLMALLTFFFFSLLFFYISRRKPDVNWGSSTQAHNYRNALQGVIKLDHTDEHVKNYRPQILVLTGHPAARPSLVDFFYNITKGKSLMICGYILPYPPSNSVFATINQLNETVREWLKRRNVKSLFDCTADPSLRSGVQSMLQLSGIGKLRPNILAMGYKNDWANKGENGLAELNNYFGVIQDAFDNNMGVAILRNSSGGFDYSDAMINEQDSLTGSPGKTLTVPGTTREGLTGKRRAASDLIEKVGEIAEEAARSPDEQPPLSILNEYMEGEHESEDFKNEEKDEKRRLAPNGPSNQKTEKAMLASINRFQQKVKGAIIDVWWLYDDGGLALLVPYLLSQPKSYLENANLRVFTISTSVSGMEQEKRNMAALLSKFRIGFSDVTVISDIAREPQRETLDEFSDLVRPFRRKTTEGEECEDGLISDAEWSAQRNKGKRQLRIAELLRSHSTDANLIVLSLPVPRKGLVSSALYMSWLEIMTRNLPPVLLVRGNQSSVLTFYS